MWKPFVAAAAFFALLFTGCAQIPPTPQDVQAKRFEPAPGRAVIYLVRTRPDVSYLTAQVMLDDRLVGSTYAGTYLRFEVPPGRHRISGYGADSGSITLDVQADRMYFVQQTVSGSWRATNPMSLFSVISESAGRSAVARGELAG